MLPILILAVLIRVVRTDSQPQLPEIRTCKQCNYATHSIEKTRIAMITRVRALIEGASHLDVKAIYSDSTIKSQFAEMCTAVTVLQTCHKLKCDKDDTLLDGMENFFPADKRIEEFMPKECEEIVNEAFRRHGQRRKQEL